jgi:hypothetical protein
LGGIGLLQVVLAGVEVHVEKRAAVGDTGIGPRIAGIDDNGAGKHLAGKLEPLLPELVEELAALEIEVVGLDVDLGGLLDHLLGLAGAQGHVQGVDDTLGDLVLDGKDILELAVEAIRPEAVPVRDVDQLGGDAELVGRFANAPFEHRADVEPLTDLADIRVGVLELEG